jgi:hypothetical protein
MTPLSTQELPWGFWLAFGLVYGAMFGHFATVFVRFLRESRERRREQEQRERNWLAADAGRRIETSESLPLSLAMREAYERGRWEGMVSSRLDQQTQSLRTVLDQLQRIDHKLNQSE